MKKIVVASKNPVKVNAVHLACKEMFPQEKFDIEGMSVPSNVSDQPMNNKETFQGALNRAQNAKDKFDADFYVGIEGGIEDTKRGMECFAWIVFISRDSVIGKAKTATFYLPPKVAELIKEGKELGEADDIVFKKENSKQSSGAVGILTNNIIDRTMYYKEASILALIPFVNSQLYS